MRKAAVAVAGAFTEFAFASSQESSHMVAKTGEVYNDDAQCFTIIIIIFMGTGDVQRTHRGSQRVPTGLKQLLCQSFVILLPLT